MEEKNWLIIGIVGIVLAIAGQLLAMVTVMKTTTYYGMPMTVPSMPYVIPGLAMTVIGGLGSLGIIVWWYKRSKKVAIEVIRDAIVEAEEVKKEK